VSNRRTVGHRELKSLKTKDINVKKNILIFGIAAAMVLSAVPMANAGAILTLSSGGKSVTIGDGTARDLDPDAGVVTWIGSIGNWSVNVTSGETYPIEGTTANPQMDLDSLDNYTGTKPFQALTITFTDTGYTGLGSLLAAIGGTLPKGWTLSDTVTENTKVAASDSFTTKGPGVFFGADFNGGIVAPTPYSLTETIVITPTAAGVASFDANLSVPDGGATLAMLSSALVCIGSFRTKFGARRG
jgi:hypothetical protein